MGVAKEGNIKKAPGLMSIGPHIVRSICELLGLSDFEFEILAASTYFAYLSFLIILAFLFCKVYSHANKHQYTCTTI